MDGDARQNEREGSTQVYLEHNPSPVNLNFSFYKTAGVFWALRIAKHAALDDLFNHCLEFLGRQHHEQGVKLRCLMRRPG